MTDLSLCLPFAPPPMGGGGYSVLRLFEQWLTKEGIPWSRNMSDFRRVLFVNSWVTSPQWIRLSKMWTKCVVVHRVDGWPPLYGRTDGIERRLRKINRLADLTIHQSQWARRIAVEHGLQDGPVIYNPVDTELFTPEGPRRDLSTESGPHVAVVSWSTNPLKGAEAVYRIALATPNVYFRLFGRFEHVPRTNNICAIHGSVPHAALPFELRSCDALLTMSQYEACPNHVLEAMACGLPVLYLDSGATREVVGDAGFAVTQAIAGELIRDVVTRWCRPTDPRKRAVDHFAPDVIFPQYLNAISTAR